MKWLLNIMSFIIITTSTIGITYLYNEDKTFASTQSEIIAYVEETTEESMETSSTATEASTTIQQTTSEKKSTNTSTKKTTTEKIEIPSFIRADENSTVSTSLLQSVYKEYLKIPNNVRINFEENNWKIVVVSSLKEKLGYTYSILGATVYREKTIYIDNKASAVSSLTHEMGHYINYMNGWLDEDEEFLNIYNEEKQSFINCTNTHKNNTSTAIEYYAEAYSEFINSPSKLQKNCPKTYDFLVKTSNNL